MKAIRMIPAAIWAVVALAAGTVRAQTASLPFFVDFGTANYHLNDQWSQEADDWGIETSYGYLFCDKLHVPLYSPGFNLNAQNTYRLTTRYYAGFEHGSTYYDGFMVLCGKSGSELSSYDTVLNVVDGLTVSDDGDFDTAIFTVKESGLYNLAIVYTQSNPYKTLAIYTIGLDEIEGEPTVCRTKAETGLRLYPNPARQTVTIASDKEMESVVLYNPGGREISAFHKATCEFRYNVSKLPAGMYFARVKTATGIQILKFVVE